MVDLRPLLVLLCVLSGKQCQIARPLYKTKCVVSGSDRPLKNVYSINFKMGTLRPLLTLICEISRKSCQIARPLHKIKMCYFTGGYALQKFKLEKNMGYTTLELDTS